MAFSEDGNLEVTRDGDIVTIRFDARRRLRPSSTGKNMLVCSSNGVADIPGGEGMRFTMSAYVKKAPK